MRRNLAPSQQRKPDSGFCPPSILGPSGAAPKPFPVPRPPTAFVARQQQPVPVDSGFVNTGLKLKPFIQTLEKLYYQYYHASKIIFACKCDENIYLKALFVKSFLHGTIIGYLQGLCRKGRNI